MKGSSLRRIDISCNQIGKEDARVLKRALEENVTPIMQLDIRNNLIDDRKPQSNFS